MKKKYLVTLTNEERRSLRALISSGKGAARKLVHARILLKADSSRRGPGWGDAEIAEGLEVGTALVRRKPQRDYRRRLDGDGEAHLIALACSETPEGRARWTLRLLADRMVALEYVETLSKDTVHRVLKKTSLSLG